MKVGGKDFRTVWMEGSRVFMIEQNLLPFIFKVIELKSYLDTCYAIKTMITRGAGAIGASAGFAMAQAYLQYGQDEKEILKAKQSIKSTRPTARNLFYAVDEVYKAGKTSVEAAVKRALEIADKDAADSREIGKVGSELIKDGYNVVTHCNAGWLAFVDYGTALSPVYTAREQGKKVFVYVNETRPRSQGARLTAWELHNEAIDFRIIPDNATASLMAQGKIDIMIVGADRVAANGDVANKIGTLEKAVAAREFGVPFYVAAPTSTIDFECCSGDLINIEERDEEEVLYQEGPDEEGVMRKIRVAAPGARALNIAFDVTPAKYISGIITEKGILKPSDLS